MWDDTGYPTRAGQSTWKPYETLPWLAQARMLEAAAVTIQLLHSKTVRSLGADTTLFAPEEILRDYDSNPPKRSPAPQRPFIN